MPVGMQGRSNEAEGPDRRPTAGKSFRTRSKSRTTRREGIFAHRVLHDEMVAIFRRLCRNRNHGHNAIHSAMAPRRSCPGNHGTGRRCQRRLRGGRFADAAAPGRILRACGLCPGVACESRRVLGGQRLGWTPPENEQCGWAIGGLTAFSVFVDQGDPGWTATVDGMAVPIMLPTEPCEP